MPFKCLLQENVMTPAAPIAKPLAYLEIWNPLCNPLAPGISLTVPHD